MIVKIRKSKLKTYWYSDKIGQVFLVIPTLDKDLAFQTVDGGRWINLEDCTITEISLSELKRMITSLGGKVSANVIT